MIDRWIARWLGGIAGICSFILLAMGDHTNITREAVGIGGMIGAGLIFAWLAPAIYEEGKQ